MIPPEKVIPMCGARLGKIKPIQFINPKAKAHMNAWNPQNNHGAKNKNVNSRGSVIPVRNEVNPADATIDSANFLFSLGHATTMAAAAAGRPNIMNTYLPCKYCPMFTPSNDKSENVIVCWPITFIIICEDEPLPIIFTVLPTK